MQKIQALAGAMVAMFAKVNAEVSSAVVMIQAAPTVAAPNQRREKRAPTPSLVLGYHRRFTRQRQRDADRALDGRYDWGSH